MSVSLDLLPKEEHSTESISMSDMLGDCQIFSNYQAFNIYLLFTKDYNSKDIFVY
jgi:hypothetical protein